MTPFPLGRHAEAGDHHDPRSLDFPAASALPLVSRRWRRIGAVLDQLKIGSCTGNATIHSRNCLPAHRVGTVIYGEYTAQEVYSLATHLDGYPGAWNIDGTGQDTGSDGLSVAKAAVQMSLIAGYTHAFGVDHMAAALMYGPVIIGVDWYNDMFNPDPSGLVHPTGGVAGAHEFCCNGIDMTHRVFRFVNSWSSAWGVNGMFYMTWADTAALLGAQGDAISFQMS